ncbi:unnamed protein product [Scytosiphon promiscuus]
MFFTGVGSGLAVARAISLGCGFMSSSARGAAAAAAACPASYSPSAASPLPVYFDHDGGSDDFVALLYLLKHEHRRDFLFNLLGVSVTPANSWWKAGTSTTRKILRTFSARNRPSSSSAERQAVPVAECTFTGVNMFPDAWRFDACKLNLLPQLNADFETEEQLRRLEEGDEDPSNGVSGQQLMAQTLLASESPVTVIATGPMTNLAWVLDNFPEASSKISKVLIMGGAIDVAGNVFPEAVEGVDGRAEWNIFWDPPAAKRVWNSDLELVLTPLDATNEVPVTKEMLLRLGQHKDSPWSNLVGSIWALAGGSILETKSRPFYAWDLVTVAQLVHPELFTTSEVECGIVLEGASQGRTARTKIAHAALSYALSSAPGQQQQQQQRPSVVVDGVSGGRKVTVIKARSGKDLMDVILSELGSSCGDDDTA